MTLNASKFSLAAALTAGAWYVICAFLVAVAPDFALQTFGWIVHLVNLESAVQGGVSFPGAIYGFVAIVVLAYATVYVFAWLYNKLVQARA